MTRDNLGSDGIRAAFYNITGDTWKLSQNWSETPVGKGATAEIDDAGGTGALFPRQLPKGLWEPPLVA